MSIKFTKELAVKYGIRENELCILAKWIGVKRVDRMYLWNEKNIEKLEKLIKWKIHL